LLALRACPRSHPFVALVIARAATTADAFNAVAEPRRRQILDVRAGGERPVNDLVQRLYRRNGHALKPIHDWVKNDERSWSERFEELDAVLEEADSAGKMTRVEIDVRVGGRRYVMVAHGGFDVAFHGEFREIVPNERIVTTEVYEAPDADALPEGEAPLNIVTFTEADGRTILTLLTQAPNRQLCDAMIDCGRETGMQEQMDLLEQIAVSLR
jgi:uncharacterized protein YndB with AHSA1/START domain